MYRENATRYISVLGYVGYKKVQNNLAVRDDPQVTVGGRPVAVSCHRVRICGGGGGSKLPLNLLRRSRPPCVD